MCLSVPIKTCPKSAMEVLFDDASFHLVLEKIAKERMIRIERKLWRHCVEVALLRNRVLLEDLRDAWAKGMTLKGSSLAY